MRTATILVSAMLVTASIGLAQPIPNEPWTTIAGDEIVPADIASRGPTLITFWALWCAPCKLEMRELKALHERYSGEGFSIIAVNEDSPRSTAKVRTYVSANGFPFHVVNDPNGQILQQFNVQALPHGFLYDRDGTIAHATVGYKPGDEKMLEDAIRKILGRQ